MDLDAQSEPDLVLIAHDVRARRRDPGEFDAAFAGATLYVHRPQDRVGVMAAELPGRGRWVLAFSSLARLAHHSGDVPWLSTTGADLLDQLPRALGVLVDVDDPHGLPLLPQPHGGRPRFGDATLPPKPADMPERPPGANPI
ncbi:SseB family protein [Saccharopolyspora sp. 7B]|uniref:SseB family protein n=2 Tax=unclassified Saccharopolyspora TaxID=2646250 RepID=UPI001CD4F92F|nr:SseB family protein [Saccharopolyspora sp. 7B]MCA1278981.1 SseB family protein [Saccharopolyspora sp. 7B]